MSEKPDALISRHECSGPPSSVSIFPWYRQLRRGLVIGAAFVLTGCGGTAPGSVPTSSLGASRAAVVSTAGPVASRSTTAPVQVTPARSPASAAAGGQKVWTKDELAKALGVQWTTATGVTCDPGGAQPSPTLTAASARFVIYAMFDSSTAAADYVAWWTARINDANSHEVVCKIDGTRIAQHIVGPTSVTTNGDLVELSSLTSYDSPNKTLTKEWYRTCGNLMIKGNFDTNPPAPCP